MISLISRHTSRIMMQASQSAVHNQHLYRGLYRAGAIYTSQRYKTYLVGVDGSEYGYNALKTTCKGANKTDKIVAMFFPTSIALYMERSATFRLSDNQIALMKSDLMEAQTKNNEEIEKKCEEIIKGYAPEHINAYCKIGKESFVPRDELIRACYEKNADILVVGSKGLSHSLTEKVTDTIRKTGGLADFAVHHAPCDVMVIKTTHEY